jgi:hypothetical protein
MPPSATGDDGSSTTAAASTDPSQSQPPSKPKFVVSQSGHAAHPDDIIASCQTLAAHIQKVQVRIEAFSYYDFWRRQSHLLNPNLEYGVILSESDGEIIDGSVAVYPNLAV